MRRFVRRSAAPHHADLDGVERVGEAGAVHRKPVLFVEPTRPVIRETEPLDGLDDARHGDTVRSPAAPAETADRSS
jgi:hypothetical protein